MLHVTHTEEISVAMSSHVSRAISLLFVSSSQIALPALYSLTLPVIANFTLGFFFGPGSDNSDFRRKLDATLTATWAYW